MGGFDPGPLSAVGLIVPAIGIAWMIRIYRADPEAGERTWRYRDF